MDFKKIQYRVKVTIRPDESKLYYPQRRFWYGWCYIAFERWGDIIKYHTYKEAEDIIDEYHQSFLNKKESTFQYIEVPSKDI